MKKILLIIMAVALCTSLMAQPQMVKKSVMSQKGTTEKYLKNACDVSNEDNETVPTLRQSAMFPTDEKFTVIGKTCYNVATNGSSRNTISFREKSNTAAAVWTMAETNASRGTGINYFNNLNWRAQPNPLTDRVETQRTGFGGHAFTAQGEVVVAHHTPTSGQYLGMVINTRDKWGEGAWTETILNGPEYTIMSPTLKTTKGIMWPTVFAVGNTVHMFCVTEAYSTPTGGVPYNEEGFPEEKFGYKGYTTYPLYYKSIDGGKTWAPPVLFGPTESDGNGLLDSYQTFKFSGDDYVITAKGNHVVILFSTVYGMVYYVESKDAGVTWEKHMVYDVGHIFLQSYEEEVNWRILPRSGAVAIDETGMVHVAFTSVMNHRSVDGLAPYHLWPVGIFYWNSSMPQINADIMQAIRDDSGDVIALFEDYPGYIHLPSVVGFDQYYTFVGGPAYDRDQFHDNGWASFVRIYAENGKVYVSYQAPLDPPINFEIDSEPIFCRGIFITVSGDNGATWDVQENTSWLSYSPELLMINWSGYTEDKWPVFDEDGNLINWEPGAIDAGIEVITENGFPSMSYNTRENSIMFQWINHFITPFPNNGVVLENDPLSIFTTSQNLGNLPCYNNVNYIYKGLVKEGCFICDEKFPRLTNICDNSECAEEKITVKIEWKKPCIADDITKYYILKDSVQIGEVEADVFEFIDEVEIDATGFSYMVKTNVDDSMSPEIEYTIGATICGCDDPPGVKNIPAPIVKIYPNPTNGEVIFDINATGAYTLTISNIMGQQISSMNGNTNRVNLNVSNYASGVYFVTVKTANAMTTQKLIVK